MGFYRRRRRTRIRDPYTHLQEPGQSYAVKQHEGTGPVYIDAGTISDVREWLTEAIKRQAPVFKAWEHDGRDQDWNGGVTGDKILKACTDGIEVPEGMIPSVGETDWLPAKFAARLGRDRRWTVGPGQAWNIPGLLANTPNYALVTRRGIADGPVVQLVVSASVSCGIPASSLVQRAGAIVKVVQDIQSTGRGVEVWVSTDNSGNAYVGRDSNGDRDCSVRTRIKGADEPVDTAQLFWWLGHPAAMRCVYYPWAETTLLRRMGVDPMTARRNQMLYGGLIPQPPAPWPDDPPSAYIREVKWTPDGTWNAYVQNIVATAFGAEAIEAND